MNQPASVPEVVPASVPAASSTARVIRADDLRRMPWRNGQGSTREVLRVPDVEDWQWRLSIADITRDAAFSAFPGMERILVLLGGAGVELRFDDGERVVLDRPDAAHRFAGERPLTGVLLAGPTTDLNLMWRREAFDADLAVRDLGTVGSLTAAAGETWALHVAEGSAVVDGTALGPGDTWVGGPALAAWNVTVTGSGRAVFMGLRPVARPSA